MNKQLIEEGTELRKEFVKNTYDIGYNLRPKEIGDKERYFKWLEKAKQLIAKDTGAHIKFSKWDKDNFRKMTPEDHEELLEALNYD